MQPDRYAPIAFFDNYSPVPFDSGSLGGMPLGGTEAAMLRVAENLDARVMQACRNKTNGRFIGYQSMPQIKHAVVMRDSSAIAKARELFPQARLYLWLHDRMAPGSTRLRRLRSMSETLARLHVTLVCVSDYQRRHVEAVWDEKRFGPRTIARIYNPVADGLCPSVHPVDPHKLIFFSSPNKGLRFTLDVFYAARRRIPGLRLLVANPGYRSFPAPIMDGVQYLGAMSQDRLWNEVRGALCTVAFNLVLPETFGLVFAESHALGTPVLTHQYGAAKEIVVDPEQLLPAGVRQRAFVTATRSLPGWWRPAYTRIGTRLDVFTDHIQRLRRWHDGGRPVTGPDPRFSLSAVVEQWRRLFAMPAES